MIADLLTAVSVAGVTALAFAYRAARAREEAVRRRLEALRDNCCIHNRLGQFVSYDNATLREQAHAEGMIP